MKATTKTNRMIKGILIISILVLNIGLKAQSATSETKAGISINSISNTFNISGNGFGLRFNPALGIGLNERLELAIGPVFKMDKPNLSGYSVRANMVLFSSRKSNSGKTGLTVFTSFERMTNQQLGNYSNEMEQFISRRTEMGSFDYKSIKFKGFSVTSGFTMLYKFNKNFSMSGDIGIELYKVNRTNHIDLRLYHQSQGIVLNLGVTMRYHL